MRRTLWLIAVIALTAPGAANAVVEIEGFYGLEQPPDTSFSSAAGGAANTTASDLFDTSLQLAGADVLFNLGGFELGAIADVTFGNNNPSQTALGALGGFALGLGAIKIDLLGEVGGHRYGNFTSNPDIVTSSSSNEWLLYVGLRPGISFKLGNGPLTLGLWAFARWDVTTQNVPVTVGSAGSAGTYKVGGTTIGATLRLGFQL
jgi:hypothetical protein